MRLRRTRPIRFTAAVAVAVLASAIGATPYAGATPHTTPDPAAAPFATVDGAGAVVTLITGDRVRVATSAGGRTSVEVMPAGGRERIGFLRSTRFGKHGNETSVVPVDAAPLLRAGKLDPALFNVTELVRDGFTDAASPTLPLILTYAQASAAAAVRPAGIAAATRALPSIDGVAIRQEKRQGSELWRWLTGASSTQRTSRRTLAAGIERIWLDGLAHPSLDVSVPQIGAPAAWQAGLTGTGVTVAVLDTGVKADHPDLAGVVVGQRDFTDSLPGGGDDVGHGTHVAGIIAGSGAASGGRYKGVAPGAKLIDGKVCRLEGCPHSAIVAGMEWAATRARVVNMSLGGEATDGTDPLSLAINNLTAQHGTLFAIAAGNGGPNSLVSSPASADAALAVGSVTKQDATSSFSSPGPRLGDFAVKPDIGAPGSDIVAARAKGTPVGDIFPVDDNYTRLNGTSMATPHAAGAAAILAQQHPDWRAEQLKAGLMSAAKPTAGVFDQGPGRVDVARATSQRITSAGSVSFGRLLWPRGAAVTKKVTYRNDGGAAVSLSLSLTATGQDGKPAPTGMFVPSANTVSVPAHGTAGVTLTVSPAAVGTAGGLFGGRLTATGGGATVQTAFGASVEPESYNLTVRDLGRNGAFEDGFAQLVNAKTGQVFFSEDLSFDADGVAVKRVPAGKWDVNMVDIAFDPENIEQPYTITAMSRPNVTVARDTTVTLDPTKGKPVAAVVDKPDAKPFFGELGLVAGTETAGGGFISWSGMADARIFAVPSGAPVTDHIHVFFFGATMAAVEPGTDPAAYVYHLAFWKRGGIPANTTFRVRDRDLATVNARYHTQGAVTDYALRTDAAEYPLIGEGSRHQSYPHTVPSRRTEYYSASPDVTWSHHLQVSNGASLDVESHRSFRSYQPGRYDIGWNRAPIGPAWGSPSLNWWVKRDAKRMLVAVPLLSASDPYQYNAPSDSVTGTATLTRDGRVIGTGDRPGIGKFDIPDTAGTYTLRATANRSVPWSVVGTKADVTWTFKEPGATAPAVPLQLFVVRASGAVDEQGRAPAGQRFRLELTAQHQPGAPAARLTQVRVEASYDDGARWVSVPTEFSGSHGCATINHPTGNRFVSLRITARDAAGNSVAQTVIRAYQTTTTGP